MVSYIIVVAIIVLVHSMLLAMHVIYNHWMQVQKVGNRVKTIRTNIICTHYYINSFSFRYN